MQKLGRTQQAIYEYITNYIETNAISPTIREICAAVGLRSTSTVHTHLKALTDAGLICFEPDKRRTIKLIGKRAQAQDSALRFINELGTVAAGTPILAYDNIIGRYPLPASMLRGADESEAFLLRVKGESMINAGILDGDLIIVHTGLRIESGDIAVARIHGEDATVKRVYYMQDKIKLQPENPGMEPMIFDIGDVELLGRVIGLMRGM